MTRRQPDRVPASSADSSQPERRPHDAAYWARRAQELLRLPVDYDSPVVSGDLSRRSARVSASSLLL